MAILKSAVPTLDVDINIFHSLYPVGRERWYTVLLLTDDPGPTPGEPTIYTDLSQVRGDYPEGSLTYAAARMFFMQPNVNDVWIMPVKPTADTFPYQYVDWARTLNEWIERKGLGFYYIVPVLADEDTLFELVSASTAYECITVVGNWPGARATLQTGEGTNSLIWTVRMPGAKGNTYTLAYVKPDAPSRPLSVNAVQNTAGGWDLTVSLATDSEGNAISTAEDIASYVNSDPFLSFLVHVSAGGQGVVAPMTKTSFSGGGEGASTINSMAAWAKAVHSPRVFVAMHDKPEVYFPHVACAALFSTMNPGSFTPKNRIVVGIPEANYTVTELSKIREANLNTIFRNPAGHINITDGWATDGLFIDIQMAIDVLAYWQRMAIWDLLSQPPPPYHKVPYDDDGFALIVDRIYHTLLRGARPEWNFIISRNGQPACRIIAPTFEQTDIIDRKNRIYRLRWEATFKGAVHEVDVRGYLTVEFIPPTEVRLGSGVEFTYG